MSKTIKIFLISFAIPLSIILIIVFYSFTAEGVILQDSASVEYIGTYDGNYYLVNEGSVDKHYFDEDTNYRINNTIDFNACDIVKIKTFDKTFTNPFTKYARIAINSDSVIYCTLLDYKKNDYIRTGYSFYAPYGFKIPEYSADNISKLEIFVHDESDESKYIPLFTFNEYDEIEYFFSHYEEYISKYTSEETGLFACLIYYKEYNFEEQLLEDDLEYLLSE